MRFVITCILFFGFALFSASSPFAQVSGQPPQKDSTKEFEVIRGPSMRMIQTDTGTLHIIAGGAIVRQGQTTFYADSMIFNTNSRILESFGKVHINDGDTVNIYSQYLFYNGIDKFSILKKNVKLTGKNGTLFTEELDYNMDAGIANYYHNGKIINKKNIITSQSGTYYADTKDVYFKKDVKMDGPKDHIRADSLIYNMNDGNITFVSNTFLWNKEVEIRTTEGRYNTNSGDAFFSARTNVKDSSNRIYEANTMALEGKTGNAQLEGNAVIIDSANGFNLIANQVFMNNQNNSFLATKKPVLIIKQKKDSGYIAADTIFTGVAKMLEHQIIYPTDTATQLNKQQSEIISKLHADSVINSPTSPDSISVETLIRPTSPDSLRSIPKTDSAGKDAIIKPPERDSVNLPGKLKEIQVDSVKTEGLDSLLLEKNGADNIIATKPVKDSTAKQGDSTRYFIAYHNVRIFNDSLQSVCDSLFISSRDSVFRLYGSPVAWTGRTQVTGDTMFLFTKNKEPQRLFAFDHCFVVNQTLEGFFNQVEGKTLNAKFRDNKFDSIRVRGSQAETVYYLQDEDSAYYGIERGSNDVIQMYFKDGELQKILLINQVKGKIYPMWNMPEDQKKLKGFEWLDKRRPKNKMELFL